jgi:hypothetical protein
MRDRKRPAHDARHRIPAGRKSLKLVLVPRPGAAGVERARTDPYSQQREEALYKAMVARAKEKQTDARDYHEDEGDRGIWVPERWVAVEYARGHVRLEVIGAGGTKLLGVRKSNREDECRAATAGLEVILDNYGDPDIPAFIEVARKQWIPALKRAHAARNQRGSPTKARASLHKERWSYLPRFQTIALAVDAVRRKYGSRPTLCFSIVSEALQRERLIPNSKESVGRIWRKRQKKP